METREILERVKKAKAEVMRSDEAARKEALNEMADSLILNIDVILEANKEDLKAAEGRISPVMMDRLRLDEARIFAMANGIREVAQLPDPVGRVLTRTTRPNGLEIEKVQVPMGVIAIIYESRPNVTSDAASLAIKAGSACVLRSGRDAHRSAKAITDAMKAGLKVSSLPEDALFLIDDTSRESAAELMRARGYVDLLIPRGGKNLIRSCVEQATVPVLETGTGICHIFVDASADEQQALSIIENAKCSRPSVCNAMEVLLLHEAVAPAFFPKLYRRLTAEREARGLTPVRFAADETDLKILSSEPEMKYLIPALPEDFDTEHLDYKMTVGIVRDTEEAVRHVNAHSTGHSESILTEDRANAEYFLKNVDSACVYVNASTRFTDGGEFGFGAEMGISTQKLHGRGPLGLNELCTYKYLIRGNGQVR
ncbi:MAG: glutamate-5-semialdehyde dehydrogenase [Lachnospiraceae bacterium]|nr:glutamate-5-semialdehyde dehydrogenase [Lachnospiraceae bacterium]MBR4768071.1 glutamate-5-semialdehyde dehydrogenase [Lachnospiraceae bacterium]